MNRFKSMDKIVRGAGAALELRSLSLWPAEKAGQAVACDISFAVTPGRTMALIGESGAGKTSLALAIMGLWPGDKSGHIYFGGQELGGAAGPDWGSLRGRRLVLMMQDPTASLNPVLTIGYQLREILRFRRGPAKTVAKAEALACLERVGLAPAGEIARLYLHELSGGMAQRAALALALACEPQFLIADEPFSALDPETAADQIELLKGYRARLGFSLLLITHDLRLARDLADDVVVLRGGLVVEAGDIKEIFAGPKAEYTADLLAAAGLTEKARV